MMTAWGDRPQAVFIVRLARDAAGKVTGVVERVRNGQKERFTALEEVGAIVAQMLAEDEAEAPARQV
jgi:hypothetical protein